MDIRFKNREAAGQKLAEKLLAYKSKEPLVLALPRGGVPVGYEVSKMLETPLDTLVVRKIGAPENLELGVGAIAPGDVIMIDNNSLNTLGLTEKDVEPIIKKEMEEMKRRILHYRSGEYSQNGSADTIIIVDDGLATGVTARAAVESALLQYKPLKLVFATPVCARESAEMLRNLVDVVCLEEADDFVAVGYWYEDFPQTTDEEVVELLEKAKAFAPPKP